MHLVGVFIKKTVFSGCFPKSGNTKRRSRRKKTLEWEYGLFAQKLKISKNYLSRKTSKSEKVTYHAKGPLTFRAKHLTNYFSDKCIKIKKDCYWSSRKSKLTFQKKHKVTFWAKVKKSCFTPKVEKSLFKKKTAKSQWVDSIDCFSCKRTKRHCCCKISK